MRKLLLAPLLLLCALPAAAASPRILPDQDAWPVWSPQGDRIAFTRVSSSRMTLDVLDVGSRRVRQVATNTYQLHPSWRRDGRSLLFEVRRLIYATRLGSRPQLVAGGTAPAASPTDDRFVYLGLDSSENRLHLWVREGARQDRLATDVIGQPAWSPDAALIAFQRPRGLYVVPADQTEGQSRLLVEVANPGPPSWSPDGQSIAYAAAGRVWVVPSDGSASPQAISPGLSDLGTPSWSRQGDAVTYSRRGGVEISYLSGESSMLVPTLLGLGAAFSPVMDVVAFAGSRRTCPGHVVIRIYYDNALNGPVTGTCEVRGTPGADVIEGTSSWGDVILAGAGNDRVHANDGHTDRVDCGSGRDTVWADRTDRLTSCEIVHR